MEVLLHWILAQDIYNFLTFIVICVCFQSPKPIIPVTDDGDDDDDDEEAEDMEAFEESGMLENDEVRNSTCKTFLGCLF